MVTSAAFAANAGDEATALAYAGQAAEIAERIGSPMLRVYASWALGSAELARRQWQAAAAAFEQALALARER